MTFKNRKFFSVPQRRKLTCRFLRNNLRNNLDKMQFDSGLHLSFSHSAPGVDHPHFSHLSFTSDDLFSIGCRIISNIALKTITPSLKKLSVEVREVIFIATTNIPFWRWVLHGVQGGGTRQLCYYLDLAARRLCGVERVKKQLTFVILSWH